MQTIKDYAFKRGDLVLMHNMAVEKSLNRKMKARYLGLLIVLARNKGGSLYPVRVRWFSVKEHSRSI